MPDDSSGEEIELAGRPSVGGEERLSRQVLILMATRLAIATASLGIGLGLDALGGHITVSEWQGFYWTVAFAFVATLVYRLFFGRVLHARRFAAMNIATDIALVSALVLFSGGRESVFIFLYMAVAMSAAMFFRRFEALGWGVAAGVAYGLVLLADQQGWVGEGGAPEAWPVALSTWVVLTGALALVSALTSFLAGELERAGRALDQRTDALVHLQNLHQRTVESLVSGLLTTDRRGRVTSFNAEAERICAMPRDTALGADVEQILSGVRTLIVAADDDVLRGRARMAYRNLAGRELHLGVGAYVLRDSQGRPSGHVVIFQDVSEVVQMERELRRSERLAAVGELSASIAHEIRNPLASISGSIQMLRAKPEGLSEDSGRLMDIVVREVDRLNLLISDFLHFARPGPAKIEPVSARSVISEVLQMLEATCPDGLRVEQDVDPDLVLEADAGQLRQVLWNLLLNASQAMAEGGRIRVVAARADRGTPQGAGPEGRNEARGGARWANICVMDQGAGIPAGVADQIFDPFFTTRSEGSGLGLATVHRIVEDHGGSVRLDPPAEGFTTAIRVRLRIAEENR